MSTVKIKTEPTAAAAVDVKVKLEPSLSTADIKLEQHTSDIGTKHESDSEDDGEESEEDYIKSENEDSDDDDTEALKKQRQWICKHPGCGLSFNSTSCVSLHQHEHKLQTKLNMLGKIYTLTRQSLDDRWRCPISGCEMTLKTVKVVCNHVRVSHGNTLRQQSQQQQLPSTRTWLKQYFLGVDDFYLNDIRCGYHSTTGVFICHECRLVPECLLTHLQQKHGYNEKPIDNSALPESAVTVDADPNIDQHANNTHLVAAIREPYQQNHPDIARGWFCVTSNCGYCGYTTDNKARHKRSMHLGVQIATIPVLVLRLAYTKTQTSCFLITRIDQASGSVTTSSNRVSKHKLDYSHNGLNAHSEGESDVDLNESTNELNQKRQWSCEYPGCGRFFNSAVQLSIHRSEHKLDVVIGVQGNTYNLNRQSTDDRWLCPVPNCETTYKTVCTTRVHIQSTHSTLMKQKRVFIEDETNHQQPIIKRARPAIQYLNVNDFYICGTRCGYHTMTGVFICYKCRLVPECLLTHLQRKHGYDDKSIDSKVLPESARINGHDPSINQHISNPHLAQAIREPSQLQHPDIVRGWLCVTSSCGYCGHTKKSINDHQHREHRGEQLSTVPALVLRLLYGKAQTSSFLITRLDTTSTVNIKSSNSTSQHSDECDADDGDELVLSDYSDEDDIN